ncbi:hypothetical protein CEUSTIGMA_g8973.t1 [Chlamydomonas eustigma]|uniref:Uncharacterized protein n=1 Tax=Chlamydomonas eustigma TaxID=1157962 RepID=A0A250XEN8_9CHLO|nr:hypothetical protein CEUSTIGMA_g8973.t1 [Chlamydomonas eustigma]|eukprot:GAX81545.1 hypothetical protein CEUSTIGMA_g8973.t1 [Chlamydomonas eustigma]
MAKDETGSPEGRLYNAEATYYTAGGKDHRQRALTPLEKKLQNAREVLEKLTGMDLSRPVSVGSVHSIALREKRQQSPGCRHASPNIRNLPSSIAEESYAEGGRDVLLHSQVRKGPSHTLKVPQKKSATVIQEAPPSSRPSSAKVPAARISRIKLANPSASGVEHEPGTKASKQFEQGELTTPAVETDLLPSSETPVARPGPRVLPYHTAHRQLFNMSLLRTSTQQWEQDKTLYYSPISATSGDGPAAWPGSLRTGLMMYFTPNCKPTSISSDMPQQVLESLLYTSIEGKGIMKLKQSSKLQHQASSTGLEVQEEESQPSGPGIEASPLRLHMNSIASKAGVDPESLLRLINSESSLSAAASKSLSAHDVLSSKVSPHTSLSQQLLDNLTLTIGLPTPAASRALPLPPSTMTPTSNVSLKGGTAEGGTTAAYLKTGLTEQNVLSLADQKHPETIEMSPSMLRFTSPLRSLSPTRLAIAKEEPYKESPTEIQPTQQMPFISRGSLSRQYSLLPEDMWNPGAPGAVKPGSASAWDYQAGVYNPLQAEHLVKAANSADRNAALASPGSRRVPIANPAEPTSPSRRIARESVAEALQPPLSSPLEQSGSKPAGSPMLAAMTPFAAKSKIRMMADMQGLHPEDSKAAATVPLRLMKQWEHSLDKSRVLTISERTVKKDRSGSHLLPEDCRVRDLRYRKRHAADIAPSQPAPLASLLLSQLHRLEHEALSPRSQVLGEDVEEGADGVNGDRGTKKEGGSQAGEAGVRNAVVVVGKLSGGDAVRPRRQQRSQGLDQGAAASAPVRPLLELESSLSSSTKVKGMLNDARHFDDNLGFLEKALLSKMYGRRN